MQRKMPPADACFPCTFAGLQLCSSSSAVHRTTTSVTYFCAGHHLYGNGLVFNLNSCKRAGRHCNVNRVAANTASRLGTKPTSPPASYRGCHSSCTRDSIHTRCSNVRSHPRHSAGALLSPPTSAEPKRERQICHQSRNSAHWNSSEVFRAVFFPADN